MDCQHHCGEQADCRLALVHRIPSLKIFKSLYKPAAGACEKYTALCSNTAIFYLQKKA
jgi:hypothetical protein